MKEQTKRRLIEPKRIDPCLCGSGAKYRDCCRKALPGFSIGKAYLSAVDAERWPLALKLARADITQYRIWHNTNTRPIMSRGSAIQLMVDVDIDALAGYVERLNWLYYRLRPVEKWIETLAALSDSVDDDRWRRKIVYFQALALRVKDRVAESRNQFRRLGIVGLEETDPDILYLKCELELDDLPFGDRVALLDRVIEVSSGAAEKLQYTVAKGLQYFLIGDNSTADSVVERGLSDIIFDPDNDEHNPYKLSTSRAHHVLALLRNSVDLNRKAISTLRMLLASDGWTESGRAALLREVADEHKAFREWSAAEAAYVEAKSFQPSRFSDVMLAEVVISQKRYAEAERIIRSIDTTHFDRHNYLDLAFTKTYLALGTGKEFDLVAAKVALDSASGGEPHFEQRRLRLLLAVAERRAGTAVPAVEKSPLERLNEMVILKPAIFGVGLNINSVIDEIIKRRARKDNGGTKSHPLRK